MLLSGIEFNQKYKDINFYKLTNESEIHNGFQFKDDINEDTIPFNAHGSCTPGGIYFTEESKIGMWTYYNGSEMKFIRKVTIPDDTKIWVEEDKFKADIIVLGTRILIEDFVETYDDITEFIRQEPSNIKYIKKRTEEICKLAVSQDGYALKYVQKQTEELCKLAVSEDGFALQFVQNQTEEICKIAVTQNYFAMRYVNPKFRHLF